MIEAEGTNILSYFNEDITKAVEVIAVLNGQNQAHKGGIARLPMAVACCEIKRYKLIQQLGLSDNLEMRFASKIRFINQGEDSVDEDNGEYLDSTSDSEIDTCM